MEGGKHHVRVERVVRGLRDQHDVGVLAGPAFELARITCRKLVSFRREESSPRHIVQLVVV